MPSPPAWAGWTISYDLTSHSMGNQEMERGREEMVAQTRMPCTFIKYNLASASVAHKHATTMRMDASYQKPPAAARSASAGTAKETGTETTWCLMTSPRRWTACTSSTTFQNSNCTTELELPCPHLPHAFHLWTAGCECMFCKSKVARLKQLTLFFMNLMARMVTN